MKLLGILWNSIGQKKEEATKCIEQYGKVKYIDVNLGDEYKNFLTELYPKTDFEQDKVLYKITGLVNNYGDNTIRILIIDMPEAEKVYLKNKDKMMYKNVLELKILLRKKFSHLIVENPSYHGKKYDNVFHMTDDQDEYSNDIQIVLKYLREVIKRDNGSIIIDDFVDKKTCQPEKWGTRPKKWLNRNILFKENPTGTFENYCELFNMYLMNECGLHPAYYDLAKYENKEGIITFNVLSNEEFMIDGSHIMSEDESYTKKELIEHNNLEMLEDIIKSWCNTKGYIYNPTIMNDLHHLFIYDLLTLQPDRNPSNYAVAINSKTLHTRLVYFDNANMLFCDEPKLLELYKQRKTSIITEREKLKTFLLFSKNDTCFDKKEDLFKEYYCSVDEDYKMVVMVMLEQMTGDKIEKIFAIIEKERHFKLPTEFKQMILETYHDYHKKLMQIIKETEMTNKEKMKLLKYNSNCNKMGV